MNKSILDVFYNILVNEAKIGRVDCYFKYNIRFDTKIIEDGIEVIGEENDDLLIPTLMIKNKAMFDQLLVQYVDLALDFYDDDCYEREVIWSKYYDNELGISKEKLIMTMLWSNATVEDFNNPCEFLRKRIAFFDLGNLKEYRNKQVIGYSEVLGANIEVKIVKSGLENEAPYTLKTYLDKLETGNRIYEFPNVYFGIYNNTGYVYAIQLDKYRLILTSIMKKFDRLMYKVNDGLDVKEDTYDNYGVGNLKDITPNSLVVANILMGLFRNNGIYKVRVPSILISRWNAKVMSIFYRMKFLSDKNIPLEEVNEIMDDVKEKVLYIQSNLTEKFLRVFRRLGYHHSTIMIDSYPYEVDSNLDISILDMEDVCNNRLLDETYNLEVSMKNKER